MDIKFARSVIMADDGTILHGSPTFVMDGYSMTGGCSADYYTLSSNAVSLEYGPKTYWEKLQGTVYNVESGGTFRLAFSPIHLRGEVQIEFCANMRVGVERVIRPRDGVIDILLSGEVVSSYNVSMLPSVWNVIHISEPFNIEQESELEVQFTTNATEVVGAVEVAKANIIVRPLDSNAHISETPMPQSIGDYCLEPDNNDGRTDCFFCDEPLVRIYCEKSRGFFGVCPECDKKGVRNEDREDDQRRVE